MAKGDGFAVCTMKKQSGGGGGLSAHIDREVYDAELDRFQGKKIIKEKVRERPEN